MARVVLLLLAALVLGWSFQAAAAEKTCVRLTRYASGEMIENRCLSCRLVNVQRTRPGTNFPATRTLTIPKRTRPDRALPWPRPDANYRRPALPRRRVGALAGLRCPP